MKSEMKFIIRYRFIYRNVLLNLNYKTGDFPEAEKASLTSLALPVYPELTKEQQEFVVQ